MSIVAQPVTPIDPRLRGPRPPFETEPQAMPGTDNIMRPQPDHGEESYSGSDKLAGFKTLVTGGDSGIGRAVALAFAREGADVAIAYLESHQDAHTTVDLVEASGARALLLPGDLSDPQHCQRVIQRVQDQWGSLHVLVNNAAYQMTYKDFEEISPEEIEYTFRTNIFSIMYLCQAALGVMEPGSSIINTASIQAYQPSPTLIPYAATKAAIVDFTKSLAQTAIKKGIRVNAVAPGPVWTPLIPASMDAEKVRNFGEDTLLERPAQPAELAPVFVLLASPQASFITGMIYGVTGGEPIN